MPAIKPTRSVSGVALRMVRRETKTSIRQLAARSGYSFTYLAKLERGAATCPSDDVIDAIAGALRCSPHMFARKAAS
jgi:transcriptional regulator with XRE-family HTH domain